MPFLQLATIQKAGSHLSRPIGLSSKIVPTLTENCFLQPLHFHRRRVERKDGSGASHRGQVTPFGQRREATNASATSGSAKNLTASRRVSGERVSVSMHREYQGNPGESSILLPKFALRLY